MMEDGWSLQYIVSQMVGPLTKTAPEEVLIQVRKFFDEAWQRAALLLDDLREHYPHTYNIHRKG
jgi:hypothetical protein